MKNYLLDTNCFFAVSKNKSKQEKLKSIKPRVTTSPLAIIEILKLSDKEKDFHKRRAAMKAVDFIKPGILEETPDDIVCRAFNQPESATDPIGYKSMIRAMILAKSYEHAIRGVEDRKRRQRYKIDPGAIHEWKRIFSSYFTEAIVYGNKATTEQFLRQLKEQYKELDERKLKKIARELNARTNEQEKAKSYTIIGLSVRSGLHTEKELIQAIEKGELEKLEKQANKAYDDSLESYIKCILLIKNMFQMVGVQKETLYLTWNSLFIWMHMVHLLHLSLQSRYGYN
jgi:hypothetical protein